MSIGKTADGVEIVEGLRVWTNDLRTGVIHLDRVSWETNYNPDHPEYGTSKPWFNVIMDGGGISSMSPDRVATRHPSTRQLA